MCPGKNSKGKIHSKRYLWDSADLSISMFYLSIVLAVAVDLECGLREIWESLPLNHRNAPAPPKQA